MNGQQCLSVKMPIVQQQQWLNNEYQCQQYIDNNINEYRILGQYWELVNGINNNNTNNNNSQQINE